MQAARRCLLAFLCAFIKGAMAILRAASLNASTKDTTMVKTEIGTGRVSDRGIGLCEGIKQRRTYERFYEDLARQNIVARLFQRQLGFRRRHTWVSVWSHMGFSHRRSVLRPLFRTLHGLLRYQRSSVLFRPVCLSSTYLSITCLSITFLSI
jgi:hypothetical protein